MSDNKVYEEALQQANDKGYESLSPEQLQQLSTIVNKKQKK